MPVGDHFARPSSPVTDRIESADGFVAIDFETANSSMDSACALGVVRVRKGKIRERLQFLINPGSRRFSFTWLHGIDANTVRDAEYFPTVWDRVSPLLTESPFLVAHNASFDAGVISACCRRYDIETPRLRFECTLRWAREKLRITPTNLAHVCSTLGIPLDHHDPLSDAEAAAAIALHVLRRQGREEVKPLW